MIGAIASHPDSVAEAAQRLVGALCCNGISVTRIARIGEAALCAASDPAGRRGGSVHGGTAFHGRIHNRTAVCGRLGLPADTGTAEVYSAALERWGENADLELIGTYCAITVRADGTLRLVRSPWAAPPLHFAATPDRIIASSVMAALFAAGHPRKVDYDYVADQLIQDHHEGEIADWYVGVNRVPIGTRIVVAAGRCEVVRYYDPTAIRPVHLPDDAAYLDAARNLLREAASAARDGINRPGLMLSGGLDSPIVAAALLDVLPRDARLPTFTFVTDPDWDGIVPADRFGDERALVERFAALHPRIDARFADPAMGGHDFRLRDLLAASGGPSANVANVGVFHGPWQMARDAGCDALLNADMGNFTFSNDATWAYVEYLKAGRLGELWRLIAADRDDPRPLWRKFASRSIVPLLPAALRRGIRALLDPDQANRPGLVSALTPQAREAYRQRAARRGAQPLQADLHAPRTRAEWIWRAWHSCDSGEDLDLAFERLYGIERRDVTAYRPLIEFCLGLPTDQFVRGGVTRYLARRLGERVMPAAQLHNPRYGLHNADWHARIAKRRDELVDYLEQARSHPFVGQAIDIDRLQALLRDWPERTPVDMAEVLPRRFALTRALTATAFIGYAEGRNDL